MPSVQAEVADRIYLSNFTPLNDASIWDGHLDAYLKPLPLKDGKPDRTLACPVAGLGSGGRAATCGTPARSILAQAPEPADVASTVDATTLRLGTGENQRRVFYPQEVTSGTVPSTLRLFVPPSGDPKNNPTPDWTDLLQGLKLTMPLTAADSATTKSSVTEIIAKTLEIKSATMQAPGLPDRNIKYVLGDIFHADPVLVDRPNDFGFYTSNLYAKPSATDCAQQPRLPVLRAAAAPAPQDAARRRQRRAAPRLRRRRLGHDAQTFTDGTGKEVFSYMPRLALPIVRDQVEDGRQIFGVDGTPQGPGRVPRSQPHRHSERGRARSGARSPSAASGRGAASTAAAGWAISSAATTPWT